MKRLMLLCTLVWLFAGGCVYYPYPEEYYSGAGYASNYYYPYTGYSYPYWYSYPNVQLNSKYYSGRQYGYGYPYYRYGSRANPRR